MRRAAAASARTTDGVGRIASAGVSGAAVAPPHATLAAPALPTAAVTSTIASIRAHRPTNGERLALAIIALWIPLQLLATWPAPLTPAFDGPWRYDTSIFAYEGAMVRHGAMPYVAFWDHKGPLIYLINAAGLALSSGHLWGIWAAGLLTVWLAAGIGYRAMRDAFGIPAALAGLVFFVVALGGFETGTNMTEEYALPLAWGAALVLVRWTETKRASTGAGIALGALGALAFFLRGQSHWRARGSAARDRARHAPRQALRRARANRGGVHCGWRSRRHSDARVARARWRASAPSGIRRSRTTSPTRRRTSRSGCSRRSRASGSRRRRRRCCFRAAGLVVCVRWLFRSRGSASALGRTHDVMMFTLDLDLGGAPARIDLRPTVRPLLHRAAPSDGDSSRRCWSRSCRRTCMHPRVAGSARALR